jgi:hypothetical protein
MGNYFLKCYLHFFSRQNAETLSIFIAMITYFYLR